MTLGQKLKSKKEYLHTTYMPTFRTLKIVLHIRVIKNGNQTVFPEEVQLAIVFCKGSDAFLLAFKVLVTRAPRK